MISPNRYEELAKAIVEGTENANARILVALRKAALELLNAPNGSNPAALRRFKREVAKITEELGERWMAWRANNLPQAYIEGRNVADAEIRSLSAMAQASGAADTGLVVLSNTATTKHRLPSKAIELFKSAGLSDAQITPYRVFDAAARRSMRDSMLAVVRSTDDAIRQVSVAAGREWLKPTDTRTRRKMAQDMLRRFTDDGITHITYADGRRISLEAYTDMSARTMAGQAAVQASMNRYAEYGYDLVRVSAHPRPSPFCLPWEGQILSRSGDTEGYPTYAEAHNNGRGLHHPSCKHFISAYREGVSSPEPPKRLLSPEEQEIYERMGEEKGATFMYEQEQKQRYYERQIRSWKYRELGSIEPTEIAKAQEKIKAYQKKVREHINENPYLRRRNDREQIGG